MGVALLILKTYWKQLLIGLVILACIAYVETLRLEVDHYKKKAGDLELVIATAKADQARETERLNLANDAMTRKYADSLRAKGDNIMKGYKDAVTRIKAHAASKRVVLQPDVVELFNATKPETNGQPPAAKPEDVVPAATYQTTVKTLNDLLLVSAENDANHQVCIETVAEWQNWWRDYAESRRRTAGTP